jgi:hypothetical protein
VEVGTTGLAGFRRFGTATEKLPGTGGTAGVFWIVGVWRASRFTTENTEDTEFAEV